MCFIRIIRICVFPSLCSLFVLVSYWCGNFSYIGWWLNVFMPIYHWYWQGRRLAVTSQREFHVTIEKGEDGYYVASVVELPGCHTQAKTLNELNRRIREVVELYLEAEGKDLHIPSLSHWRRLGFEWPTEATSSGQSKGCNQSSPSSVLQLGTQKVLTSSWSMLMAVLRQFPFILEKRSTGD